MHEAILENGFADGGGSLGHRHQRHELRLQIGGKAGKGRGGKIHRRRPAAIHAQTDAARRIAHFRAGPLEPFQKRGDGIAPCPHKFDIAARNGSGNGEGACFDAIRHHRMFGAVQHFHAFDGKPGGTQPLNPGAHRDQAMAEILDLRLARGVGDDGGAARQGGRHQCGFRRADRNGRKNDLRAMKAVFCPRQHIAVGKLDFGAHQGQGIEMQIDRPRPDGAAAGQGNLRLAMPGQQRRQHLKAGAHLADDVIGRKGGGDCGRLQPERIAFAQNALRARSATVTPKPFSSSAMARTSASRGTLRKHQRFRRQQ